MDRSELTAWEDIGGRPTRADERSLPVPPSSRRDIEFRRADARDLEPVNREEFFAVVGPCLALCGAVGMGEGDRREWLEAAFLAVGELPIALLERGAKAAMRTADHPSKIVPAIIAESGASLKFRRDLAKPLDNGPREKVIPQAEREEVGRLMKELIASLDPDKVS